MIPTGRQLLTHEQRNPLEDKADIHGNNKAHILTVKSIGKPKLTHAKRYPQKKTKYEQQYQLEDQNTHIKVWKTKNLQMNSDIH